LEDFFDRNKPDNSTSNCKPPQTHLDGSRTKKTLSERVHHDATGIKMHRDLMSAYLSRFVNQDDTLSVQDARNGYRGAEPLLLRAWQQSKNCEQVGKG
jgi:putative transposase